MWRALLLFPWPLFPYGVIEHIIGSTAVRLRLPEMVYQTHVITKNQIILYTI